MVGRELDALIAEKVMGWTRRGGTAKGDDRWGAPGLDGTRLLPRYSTDIAAAWEVVERFGFYEVGRDKDGCYCVLARYRNHNGLSARTLGMADTVPLAICLAALKAVGVELPEPVGHAAPLHPV